MSVQLLDKTRKINKLLHNNHASKVLFNDICEVMVETLDSNIKQRRSVRNGRKNRYQQ